MWADSRRLTSSMTNYPQKITFGEMRESRVRDVLIYCRDYRCGHHAGASADGWADDMRLSGIERRLVCQRCGQRGADVRPNCEPAKMGAEGL
jgi:hypothetical protein